MTTTRQPSEHPRWDAFMSSFKQSNYITDFWNWFMTLMSKAAEMVLFGTVLYSGYQLLPGVPHVPAPVDAAVFVIQQGALDIGGMGLLKLAKRANLAKDAFPVRLGMSLVVLMILNVALASIKHTLPMIPGGVFVGIETLLLMARAVVAVLFGHAIYALQEEYSESTITVHEANELQRYIDELSSELASVRERVQQCEAASEAHMRQHLASANHEAREAGNIRQHEVSKAPRKTKKVASASNTEANTRVLPLKQPGAAPMEKRTVVYALLDTDHRLSSYEIAAQTGYLPSTIQRYMKDWKARQAEAADEAADTAI
jgi:hypothetical protein